MVTIENEILKARIHPLGAELQSLYHKQHEQEYMWKGDPAYWGKFSPVLFPIVGALKDDQYIYNGQNYHLPRHGFAREMDFEIEETLTNEATFVLRSGYETLAKYPFEFEFRLHYALKGNSIKVTYDIKNPSKKDLYFSVGAHPAFAVPLTENTYFEDYYLGFEKKETTERWPIKGNLIDTEPEDFLQDQKQIPLQKELFYQDAIVFKTLKSETISILSDKTSRGLRVHFEGFPYLGIWAAKDAPFVCIEPWCGIADSVNHTQQLEEKEGIMQLAEGARWEKSWQIDCL